MSAYERLADLAADELVLVRQGRVEELAGLHARRDALVATLPAVTPVAARPALERAAVLQADVVAAIKDARQSIARELAHLRRGRGAVRAYGHVASASPTADRRG